MAKAATDAGMTYGKYRETVRNGRIPSIIEADRSSVGQEPPDGGALQNAISGRSPREERRAVGRNGRAHSLQRLETEEVRRCPYCGKEVNGRKTYCDKTCWYGFNRETAKKRARAAYARRKGKIQVDLPLCQVCGKPITAAHRSAYCSPACAQAGKAKLKREKRMHAKQ